MVDQAFQEQAQPLRDALNLQLVSLSAEQLNDISIVGPVIGQLEAFANFMESSNQPEFAVVLKHLDDLLGQMVSDLRPHVEGMQEFTRIHGAFESALEVLYGGDQPRAVTMLQAALSEGLTADEEVVEEKDYSQYQDIVQDLPPDMAGDETLVEFISETEEGLEKTEETLLKLESDLGDQQAINSIFRTVHTIKGTAGFLGLTVMGSLAHHTEDLMVQVRDGKREMNNEVLETILRSTDVLGQLVSQMKQLMSGSTPEAVDMSEAYQMLDDMLGQGPAPKRAAPAPPPPAPTPAQPAAKPVVTPPPVPDTPPPAPAAKPAEDHPAEEEKKSAPSGGQQPANTPIDMIKIPAAKLDELSEFIGEMVVALSVLSQNPTIAEIDDRELHDRLDQLHKITEQLRDRILSIRMFPVKNVFSKLTRQVRDLSRKSGKKIKLDVEGEDTLVDKTIIDSIYAPLMHIVRNAIDHGVEEEQERIEVGKPTTGNVLLAARHLGDSILIEVRDDGRGLIREKLLKKAIEKGVTTERENLSDQQVFMFIFHAGFSTAKQVTDISGRGVGMDVVKREVDNLRGKISIESTPGVGTSFLIKLPLTTSIIEGLVVRLGPNRFVLPILDVHLTITPDKEQLYDVQGQDSECFILAGEVVPIMRLHEFYQIEADITQPEEAIIVVVKDGEKKYGLMVDELLHRQQIVVKNLGDRLVGLPGITGGTILGDGRVGLILDPETLIQHFHNNQPNSTPN
jgi:two-component system chemotaxis sensor kinase CheA